MIEEYRCFQKEIKIYYIYIFENEWLTCLSSSENSSLAQKKAIEVTLKVRHI